MNKTILRKYSSSSIYLFEINLRFGKLSNSSELFTGDHTVKNVSSGVMNSFKYKAASLTFTR